MGTTVTVGAPLWGQIALFSCMGFHRPKNTVRTGWSTGYPPSSSWPLPLQSLTLELGGSLGLLQSLILQATPGELPHKDMHRQRRVAPGATSHRVHRDYDASGMGGSSGESSSEADSANTPRIYWVIGAHTPGLPARVLRPALFHAQKIITWLFLRIHIPGKNNYDPTELKECS